MALTGLDSNELKLILLGGKGGVGKTSCATAIAIELSKTFKTILISTDPAHSVSDSLEQSIGFKQQPVKGVNNLTAIEIAAEVAFSTFKEQHQAQLEKLFDTSTNLDQEDIGQLMDVSIPGIDEIMSFKIITDFLEEGKYDKLVVDTAPTGHALRLLASPKLLDEWIKVAARIRWKYRYMVTSFSGSYQNDDVDDFLLDLKKTVKRIENLLHDNTRCEFIPVCIPELMAIRGTSRLLSSLSEFEMHPRQIIVNNVMEADDCDFCKRKKASQSKYLQEIGETFKNLNMVKVPLFPEEIKGLEALNQLRICLFENKPISHDPN